MRRIWMLMMLCSLLRCVQAAPQGEHRHEHATKDEHRPFESNVDYLWRKSDEAFHKGDFERAVGLHRAIVALDPGDVESFGVGAWLLWSMGRGEEGIKFIERGVRANAQNWEMWDEAGKHYGLQKKIDKAKEAYAQAVRLIPPDEDSQMLRRRLAHAAESTGDLELSLQTWNALVRDFPNEAVNKNNRARVEQQLNESRTKSASLEHKVPLGTLALLLLGLMAPLMLPTLRRG